MPFFKRILPLFVVLLCLAACAPSRKPSAPAKQFHLSGVVISVDSKLRTATIKHGAIKDWMEAMTMEYPVAKSQDIAQLHAGDRISATIEVRGADYELTDIRKQ